MSAIKHQPETALPWGDRNSGEKISYVDAGTACGHVACSKKGDAAYIAHAANAYPKLVEQLQALLKKCAGKRPSTRTSNEKPQAPHWTDLELARGLLQDLGEDA